jgi:hypothetical protein
MFCCMRVLTIIITCTLLVELEVQENNFCSHMRIRDMEDVRMSYSHGKEIIGLHVMEKKS